MRGLCASAHGYRVLLELVPGVGLLRTVFVGGFKHVGNKCCRQQRRAITVFSSICHRCSPRHGERARFDGLGDVVLRNFHGVDKLATSLGSPPHWPARGASSRRRR